MLNRGWIAGCLLLTLAVAPPAQAGTYSGAKVDGKPTLTYIAYAGEVNVIDQTLYNPNAKEQTISCVPPPGGCRTYTRDTGAYAGASASLAAAQCSIKSPFVLHPLIFCDTFTDFEIRLRDGNDRATLTGDGVVYGGGGADTITGARKISGGAGNDTLVTTKFDDVIHPGSGTDFVDCGAGASDRVTYSGRAKGVIVMLDVVSIDGPPTGGREDNIVSCERVTGGDGADRITGTDGPNDLRGGKGKDVLVGKGGDDVLVGKSGAGDKLYGGTGSDVLYARDGLKDSLFCGSGYDTARVDSKDFVGGSCEVKKVK